MDYSEADAIKIAAAATSETMFQYLYNLALISFSTSSDDLLETFLNNRRLIVRRIDQIVDY
jgi:hypothetical protein